MDDCVTDDQLQVEKMEALGQFAAAIAHDFNNVLAVVSGFTEFAREELGDAHPVADDLAQVLAAVARGGAITARLMAFAKLQPQSPTNGQRGAGLDAVDWLPRGEGAPSTSSAQ